RAQRTGLEFAALERAISPVRGGRVGRHGRPPDVVVGQANGGADRPVPALVGVIPRPRRPSLALIRNDDAPGLSTRGAAKREGLIDLSCCRAPRSTAWRWTGWSRRYRPRCDRRRTADD